MFLLFFFSVEALATRKQNFLEFLLFADPNFLLLKIENTQTLFDFTTLMFNKRFFNENQSTKIEFLCSQLTRPISRFRLFGAEVNNKQINVHIRSVEEWIGDQRSIWFIVIVVWLIPFLGLRNGQKLSNLHASTLHTFKRCCLCSFPQAVEKKL